MRTVASFVVLAMLALARADAAPPVLQKTSGPGGGTIQSLARTTDGTLFAVSHGLYRSIDNGYTWNAITPPHLAPPYGSAQLVADAHGAVYYGGWKSVDRGDTWSPTGWPVGDLHFSAGDRIYVQSSTALHTSSDGGVNWTTLVTGAIRGFAEATNGTLFVVDNIALRQSEDGGAGWLTVTTLPSNFASLRTRVQGGVWLGTEAYEYYGTGGGLFVWNGASLDDSNLFETVGDVVTRADGRVFAACLGVCYGFGCAGGGIVSSDDGGATWTSSGLSGQVVTALIAGAGGMLFAGTAGMPPHYGFASGTGVWRTSGPGNHWTATNRGLASAATLAIAAAPGIVYAIGDGSLHWSTDRGLTWNLVVQNLTGFVPPDFLRLEADRAGTLYAQGLASEGLVRVRNRGEVVDPLGRFSRALAVTAPGTVLNAFEPNGLERSVDQGDTWEAAGAGLTEHILRLDAGPLGRVAAVTAQHVVLSEDDGQTWSVVGDREEFWYYGAGAVALSRDEKSLWFYDASGVRRLDEVGSTWTEVTVPQPQAPVHEFEFDAAGTVYVATGGPVMQLAPGAPGWEALPAPGVGDIFYDFLRQPLVFDDAGFLYTGTLMDGVLRSRESVNGPTDVEFSSPGRVRVVPFPNPFRGRISFQVTLPQRADVQFEIYDVRGRLVDNVMNGSLDARPLSISWEPNARVQSGVYYYRFRSNGELQRGRVTLVR